MKPEELNTMVLIKRIYSLLLIIKEKKDIICYSDCFTQVFDIAYSNEFCHFIQQRKIVNNIPFILGAIGRICNEMNYPPLCCLVVYKNSIQCGKRVITSKQLPESKRPDFAEKTDRPNVYNYEDYPKPGTQQAKYFLDKVMERLREQMLTKE